ncbi:unnamed protein product [Aphanomyces euteiches]|nr:hypothetical protein Ae201684P_015658 [Aphanomyces euteiches]KAH9143319.1 hypothetical protein AeRB84_012671 [Aphanomyces euteiches]
MPPKAKSKWKSVKAKLRAHVQEEDKGADAESNKAVGRRVAVEYTDLMVSTLLDLRFKVYRTAFRGNKSPKQLSLLWERLTVQFNVATNQNVRVDAESLKNKLRKLRAEFGGIQPYYDAMLTAYSDLHGLGDIEYGMERLNVADGETTEVESEQAEEEKEPEIVATRGTNKRKAEVDSEVIRQRNGRKTMQSEISSGLEKFGNTLGAALIQAASVKQVQQDRPTVIKDQMSNLMELAESMKASIDASNQVQSKLLTFLERRL